MCVRCLIGTRVVAATGGSGGYAEQVAVTAGTVFVVLEPGEVPRRGATTLTVTATAVPASISSSGREKVTFRVAARRAPSRAPG